MTVRNVGMSVKCSGTVTGSGVPQEGIPGLLDPVDMAMGQIKIHTADTLNQHLPGKGRRTVHITVSWNLIKQNVGVFKMNVLTIGIVVSQMENHIRLNLINTLPHEAHRPVRIGKNKNFHRIILPLSKLYHDSSCSQVNIPAGGTFGSAGAYSESGANLSLLGGMNMQYDPDAIRQAMKMAQTPEGQQLIRMLQTSSSTDVEKAMASASSGDYAAARQALSALLNNPEAQRLLRQMGGNHGPNGR